MNKDRTWEIDAARIDAGDGRYTLYVAMNAATREMLPPMVTDLPAPAAISKLLHQIIKAHGVPEVIITDNGSAFTSHSFLKENLHRRGIRHEVRAPFSGERGAIERRLSAETAALIRRELFGEEPQTIQETPEVSAED